MQNVLCFPPGRESGVYSVKSEAAVGLFIALSMNGTSLIGRFVLCLATLGLSYWFSV